jgi:hypothetical protein
VGLDAFFVCLGISCIIVALATARAAPDLLSMIERISLADRKGLARTVPPRDYTPGDPPWGRG